MRLLSAPALGLAAGCLLSACGGGQAPPAESASRPAARSPGAAQALGDVPPVPGPQRVVGHFQDRRPPLAPWMETLATFIDPERDGWPSEVVAERTERILAAWLTEASGPPPRGAAALHSPDLRGGESIVLRDDALLRLVRVAGATPDTSEAPLPQQLRAFLAPFANHPTVALEVLAVEKLAPRSWRTRVRYRFSGAPANDAAPAPPGARLQRLGQWDLTWAGPAGKPDPKLLSLVPVAFDEALFRQPPFSPLAPREFGAGRQFVRDLGPGSLHAAGRRDRMHPDAFLGMHGLAVGDFDGDGREELYVAQAGGLPNRLYRPRASAAGEATEVSARCGVDFLDNTSGVLAEDLDGDGAVDLALAMGSDILLAWNSGDGRFGARTILKGDGQAEVYSLCAGDPDGDGDLDLYATRYVAGGINGGVPTPYCDANNGASNHLWRQKTPRVFADHTAAAGLDINNRRFSLAAVFEDLDGDGDADLYVTNDFGLNNFYRNDAGQFTDVAGSTGTSDMAAGMGITCADVNRDGELDIYISNMFTDAGLRITAQPAFRSQRSLGAGEEYVGHTDGNTLLLGRGSGTFEDATEASGVGPGGWAWGALLRDFDGDGWTDLYVPNGFITNRAPRDLASFFWRRVVNATPEAFPPDQAYRRAWNTIQTLSLQRGYSWNGGEHNYIYWNGGGGVFSDVSAASGVDYDSDSRAVAAIDWDGDGLLELALRSRTGSGLRVLHNNASLLGNHVLNIRLEAAPGGAQGLRRTTVGTRVSVSSAGTRLEVRRRAGEGYLASSSHLLRFGLGEQTVAEEVSVNWPGGRQQVHSNLDPGRIWILSPGAEARPGPELTSGQAVPAHGSAAADSGALRTNAPQARVLLAERLPMGPLPRQALAASGNTATTWGAMQAASLGPLLLVACASGDGPSDELLSFLSAEQARTDALGLRIVPLVLDGPRLRGQALARLEELGLAGEACAVDRRLQRLLELLTLEVLGPYDELPLPLCWLLDPAAQLTCLYISPAGPGEWEELLADAGRVRYLDGSSQGTEVLSGGRWVHAPRRSTKGLAGILERLGERELSAFYGEFNVR